MRKTLFAISIIFSLKSFAQNPSPALPQKEAILILNGTAHIGNGQIIQNAAIGIVDGKLVLVADATQNNFDKGTYKIIIDAKGKQVYPGFINCNSNLGLTEVDAIRSTRDFNETGEFNPNVRSIIAYNTDSKIPQTLRSNGVLLAQVVPQGGVISGQSSIVELDAWNWEDAVYKMDEGIHLNWPRMYTILNNQNESEEAQKQKIQNNLNAVELIFSEAKAYSVNSSQSEKNLKYEAMRGLFNGSKKLYVHCDFVREIVSAVNMVNRFGIKMVLVDGADSFRVTDLLKENNIPVILGRVHSLPSREDDDFDLPFKLPFLLKQGGVSFAISIESSWGARNVMFNAGTTSAYGLTKEEALAAITLSPAKILGIDHKAGSLEVGKDATLFISEGDSMDMRTNKVTKAFIRGKDINLDNIQSQLYRKYMTKYGLN